MTRIFHWLFMWKMDPMSGFDIRLKFTLPPRDSTLQYKRCLLLWNNFLCIKSLINSKQLTPDLCGFNSSGSRKLKLCGSNRSGSRELQCCGSCRSRSRDLKGCAFNGSRSRELKWSRSNRSGFRNKNVAHPTSPDS